MNIDWKKWIIFMSLCIIWGSSFILMKLGMFDSSGNRLLNAYQVAAIRILSAGLLLVPFFLKAFRRIPSASWGYILLSGLLGSLIPAFLFCIAETRIESALTAMLNTLTPIFTVLAAALIYRNKIPANQIAGVVLGFIGCFLLFVSKRAEPVGDLVFSGYVILATICYGLSVNIVRQKLAHVNSLDIAAGAFVLFIIPCMLVLLLTGYHQLPLKNPAFLWATAAAALLGILGTGVASVIFYMLVKRAGSVFSSMVTYGIPFIALGWGILYGEKITLLQVVALIVILGGVYIASSLFFSVTKKMKKAPLPEKEIL